MLGIALFSGGIARAGQSAHFDDPKLDRVWVAQLWELTPARSGGSPALGPALGRVAPRPVAPATSTIKPSSAGNGSGLAAAPHATVATRTLAQVSPAALATDDVHGATASLKVAAAPIVP